MSVQPTPLDPDQLTQPCLVHRQLNFIWPTQFGEELILKNPSVIVASLCERADFPSDLLADHKFKDYIGNLKYRLKQKLKATCQDAKQTAWSHKKKKIESMMSNKEVSPTTARFLESYNGTVEARQDFNTNHSKNTNNSFNKDESALDSVYTNRQKAHGQRRSATRSNT